MACSRRPPMSSCDGSHTAFMREMPRLPNLSMAQYITMSNSVLSAGLLDVRRPIETCTGMLVPPRFGGSDARMCLDLGTKDG
jgi:hypothetical protein